MRAGRIKRLYLFALKRKERVDVDLSVVDGKKPVHRQTVKGTLTKHGGRIEKAAGKNKVPIRFDRETDGKGRFRPFGV
jgi:hypothetical protein